MSSLKKMGSVSKIMDLIPGMSNVNIPKEALDMGEKNMDKWKFALDSMTKAELEDPSTITQERIERISKGSGRNNGEVKELLQQFKKSKKMIRLMKGGQGTGKMAGLANKMKGMMGGKLPF